MEWWEAARDGRAPWGLPRDVGNDVMVEALTWPKEKWDRSAAEVNAEIQALIDAARERVFAARLLADTSADPLGRRWERTEHYYQMAASGDDSDVTAARDPDVAGVMQNSRDSLQPLREGERLKGLGRNDLSEAATGLAEILDCETAQLPERIKAVYDASLSIAGHLEEDNDLRSGNGGPTNLSCLPSDLRREFVEIVRRLGPWVRSFPTARKEDDELGGFLVRPELFEPTKLFISEAASAALITQADRDLILQLIAAHQRSGEVASKAAKRGVLSGSNLAIALGTVLSGLALNGYANESPLVKKTAAWLVDRAKGRLSRWSRQWPPMFSKHSICCLRT